MTIIAIDPGTTESAWLVWNTSLKLLESSCIVPNDEILRMIIKFNPTFTVLAIEMIASYGMPVGREVFETCVWIGRFIQAWRAEDYRLVFRKDVKLHLCGTTRAKDGNVRQALIDKYGPPGTKKQPGTLYGIKSHLWAAMAIADYAANNPQPQ